ncbi:MAG: hypothetical protein R3C53_00610 [Pirellulaceae bacterium]
MIVIHDVAEPFLDQIECVLRLIRPLVGTAFACAVVPNWHGREHSQHERLVNAIADCREILLHGLTHRRDHPGGVVSALTHRSDEFGGLEIAAIQARIDLAKCRIQERFRRTTTGLVPPAWQLPVRASQLQGVDFVMRFGRLESCASPSLNRPLSTYSYDWGRCGWAAWASGFLARVARYIHWQAVPCVVIHPIDVTRGWLPHINRNIENLLASGFEPITPTQCLAAQGSQT